jgi:hypothetical protein
MLSLRVDCDLRSLKGIPKDSGFSQRDGVELFDEICGVVSLYIAWVCHKNEGFGICALLGAYLKVEIKDF